VAGVINISFGIILQIRLNVDPSPWPYHARTFATVGGVRESPKALAELQGEYSCEVGLLSLSAGLDGLNESNGKMQGIMQGGGLSGGL